MTVAQVIATVDAQRIGNPYMTDEKLKWLTDIEGTIYEELVKTHENPDEITFDGFASGQDMDAELIAGDLYGDIYVYYLLAQIDRAQQETAKYNVDASLYQSLYNQFVGYYNRKHTPLQPRSITMGKECTSCCFR